MENQKCVLCKKEIKGKCYIITKPDKNSYYMSSEENLIGKFICDNEANWNDDEEQGFYDDDIDGSILTILPQNKNDNKFDFFFKEKILANNLKAKFSNEILKELCDIVKNIDARETKEHEKYFEGKNEIDNLKKAITVNSVDINSNIIITPMNNLLNYWNKKVYIVLTGQPEKSKLEIYVDKEDEPDFVKLANEKMKSFL